MGKVILADVLFAVADGLEWAAGAVETFAFRVESFGSPGLEDELGTNPFDGFDMTEWAKALDRLPASTPIPTPFPPSGIYVGDVWPPNPRIGD